MICFCLRHKRVKNDVPSVELMVELTIDWSFIT